MKPYFLWIILSVTTLFSLQAEIFETKNFKEILYHVHQESLVLVDIDDTLLIPAQSLGTDVWFISRLEHYLRIKKDRFTALDHALADWEAIRHITNVKIVEEGTQEILNEMQSKNIVMMGLTTQGLALATRTAIQLQSLSIDLSKTAPSHQDYYFVNGRNGVLYQNGILFTSGTAKGVALIKYLDSIDYHPEHIVFINDKNSHLRDVEKTVELHGMKFTGLRYGYSDERVSQYKQEIAEIQWTHSTFNHLLSDEEAASLINQ